MYMPQRALQMFDDVHELRGPKKLCGKAPLSSGENMIKERLGSPGLRGEGLPFHRNPYSENEFPQQGNYEG